MEDTGKKINYREHETPDPEMFPDISNVASANECTGLMYRVPINNAELESYQQLSPMEIPREMEDADDSVQALLHRHSKNAKEAAESVIKASREKHPLTDIPEKRRETDADKSLRPSFFFIGRLLIFPPAPPVGPAEAP